jgi:hypothetical protein
MHLTTCSIVKGLTEYKIDRKVLTLHAFFSLQVVTWEVYNAKLASFDILVKARNFLVFQVCAPTRVLRDIAG